MSKTAKYPPPSPSSHLSPPAHSFRKLLLPGMSNVAPNCVRLASNETNVDKCKISFSTFWLAEPKCKPKCTETDLKMPRFVPFGANLKQFGSHPGIPDFSCYSPVVTPLDHQPVAKHIGCTWWHWSTT